MPDITYNQFPISGKIVDFDTLQSDVANLNANAVLESRTINGYDLSEDRTIYAQDVPSKNIFNNNWRQGDWNSTGTVNRVSVEPSARVFLKSGAEYVFYNSGYASYKWSAAVLASQYATSYTTTIGWQTTEEYTYTPSSDCWVAVVIGKSDDSAITPSDVDSAVNFMIRPSTAPAGYVPYAKTNVELTNNEAVSVNFTYSSGSSSMSEVQAYRNGNIVHLKAKITASANISAGANVITGSFSIKPKLFVSGGGFAGSSFLACAFDTDGSFTVRCIGSALSSGSTPTISMVFIV